MKKSVRLIFFFIGLIGIIFLLTNSELSAVNWAEFFSNQLLFVILINCLLWILIYIIHSSVYLLILGKSKNGNVKLKVFKTVLCKLSLNIVIPGFVGGEAYSIANLKNQYGSEKATSTSLTFTFFYILGHFMTWGVGSLLFLFGKYCTDISINIIAVVICVLFFSIILLFALKKKGKPIIKPCLDFFSKLPFFGKKIKNYTAKNIQSIETVDKSILDFRKNPANFGLAILLEFSSRLLECVEYCIILKHLGQPYNLTYGILIMCTASLIGNALFFIPMQTGTREGGIILALSWLGLSTQFGIQIGLIYRIRELILVFLGIILILIERKRNTPQNYTPEE